MVLELAGWTLAIFVLICGELPSKISLRWLLPFKLCAPSRGVPETKLACGHRLQKSEQIIEYAKGHFPSSPFRSPNDTHVYGLDLP